MSEYGKKRDAELVRMTLDGDADAWLSILDGEAIPKLSLLHYDEGLGILYFWRGEANICLVRMEEALSDFIRAESLLRATPHDLYQTLTVSAQMVYEKMTRYANDPLAGFMVTAESYRKEGTKLRFGGQPGFSTTSVMFEKHKMDAINYTKHFMNPIASALCGFVEPHPIDTGTVQELDFQVRFPRINSMKLALNLHDC